MDGGEGGITFRIYTMPQRCLLNMAQMINFMLRISYQNKKMSCKGEKTFKRAKLLRTNKKYEFLKIKNERGQANEKRSCSKHYNQIGQCAAGRGTGWQPRMRTRERNKGDNGWQVAGVGFLTVSEGISEEKQVDSEGVPGGDIDRTHV